MVASRAMCVALGAGLESLHPLPKFAEFKAVAHPSRASARATRERRRHVHLANQALEASNWLHGCTKEADASSATPAQRSAMRHIWDATADALGGSGLSEFGAARELLQMGRAYGSAQTTKTAAYQEGNVSLPASGRKPVPISTRAGETAQRFLGDPDTWLLHDDRAMSEAHDHAAGIKPYSDPALRDKAKYAAFVRELWQCGIINWSRKVKGRCTPFFVRKKNGSLRLVLDCRQVNAFFRIPPGCEMGSLAAMGELEVDVGTEQQLWISQADVQDCFWQCAIPMELARWFGLDAVPGSLLISLGVTHVDGQLVHPDEFIHPVIGCLPMGWSWAMWFVQQLHETLVLEHFPESAVVRDGRPAPDLRDGDSCASPYCDNLGVIGTNPRDVLFLRECVQRSFEALGFRMHEETHAESDAQILGGRFHGEHNIIKPTSLRREKTGLAFSWVARRPRLGVGLLK